MLQSLLKPKPKASKEESPQKGSFSPKKNKLALPQLKQLERQIILKKPNNTQFIRDWANSRLNKITLSHFQYEHSDDEDQFEFPPSKSFRTLRRNAVFINDSQFLQRNSQRNQNKKKYEKLQETKSMILIILKSLEILKQINDDLLWSLVDQFEEKQYQDNEYVIQAKEKVVKFYVIVSGQVLRMAGHIPNVSNKKSIVLVDGNHFGFDSILFQGLSPDQYISQGASRIAQIEGRKITKCIRQINKQKYKNICKALLNIDYFKTLHDDQLDQIAQIGMNQPASSTEPDQEMNIDDYGLSIFIVLKGTFRSHSRKLTQALRKQPNKRFDVADAFGIESLYKQKGDYTIVSEDYGAIVEIKCTDIEKIIGSLSKISKRKRTRK